MCRVEANRCGILLLSSSQHEILEVPDRQQSGETAMFVVEASDNITARRSDGVVDYLDAVDHGIGDTSV